MLKYFIVVFFKRCLVFPSEEFFNYASLRDWIDIHCLNFVSLSCGAMQQGSHSTNNDGYTYTYTKAKGSVNEQRKASEWETWSCLYVCKIGLASWWKGTAGKVTRLQSVSVSLYSLKSSHFALPQLTGVAFRRAIQGWHEGLFQFSTPCSTQLIGHKKHN